MTLPETFAKFVQNGLVKEADVIRALPEYERCLRRYEAAGAFWADAESQIWNHNDDTVACHVRAMGLKHEVSEHYGLIGVAFRDQINKVYEAAGRQKPRRISDEGASVVFPFYDLPGRLTGFLLRQYDEGHATRQCFISLSGCRNQIPEAGYFMLKTAPSTEHEIFKNTHIISDDLLWAIKTQCQHLTASSTPLPLMVSYTGTEAASYGTSFNGLAPATRIFHASVRSPELISRACHAKGYVSVCRPEKRPPVNSLAEIRAAAKTWQESLKMATVGVPEITAESFAKRLTIPHEKLHAFFNRYPEHFSIEFRERVLTAVRRAWAAPRVQKKQKIIIERDNNWWTHTGKRVCNVRPVIEEVLQLEDGSSIYRGTVYTGDNAYGFETDATQVERLGLLAYARLLLAPHGVMVMFDRLWNASSTLTAMQLHPPKITARPTRCGWDEATNVFRTARYEITNSGDVQHLARVPKIPLNKDFPEPGVAVPLPLRALLTPAHEHSFIWTMFASVAANLVAPALQKDFEATCIDLKNESTGCRISAVLGCDEFQIAATQKHATVYNRLTRITNDIAWPVLCRGLFNDEIVNACAARYFQKPLIICSRQINMATLLSYGWTGLDAAPAAKPLDVSPLRDVLPTYIQHVLQNKAALFRTQRRVIAAVLDDLHEWLASVYGGTFNLPHATTLIRDPGQAHHAVMREAGAAVLCGKIDILPHPRRKDQAGNYFLLKNGQIWLNRRALDRYFYIARCPAPNWLAIIDLLQRDNVYVGEHIQHGMLGIFIRAAWFEQFCQLNEVVPSKEIG